MRALSITIVLAFFATGASLCLAQPKGPDAFSYYGVILSVKPFGSAPSKPPPVTAAVAPTISAEQQRFGKDKRISIIRRTDDGAIWVGITDERANDFWYLAVGETDRGMKLEEADFEKETAVISQGSLTATITTQGGTTTSAGRGAPAIRAPSRTRPGRPSRSLPRVSSPSAPRRAPRNPALSGQALEQHLRTYNKSIIRAGGNMGPALPIPLTQEDDDELVQDGYLPE